MQAFEYSCPTKIVCGAHALRKLADELRDHQVEKPLLLSDANLVKLGVAQHAIEPLEEAGVSFALFDQIPPDSSLDVVNEVVRVYTEEGCDGFVALGGGSVIDTGKGAAASISCEGADFASLQGAEILRGERPPFFAIPTTAGTGSEVTLVAVVADTAANAKLSYTSYRLVPDVAFLDPALTQSLPPKLTSTTGMDALTHAVEAYTSIQKNPVSDAFATGAIELISRNLVTACETPQDADARTALALGSLMAGVAFSNAMVGVVHALGHSLGGLCHVPHGQAMMLLLPHCVDWNIAHGMHRGLYGELLRALDPARFEQLALDAAKQQDNSLGAVDTKRLAEMRDAAFAAKLHDMNTLFHERWNVPISLSELGIARDDLPKVAHQARYDGAAIYNSYEISEETALAILEAAY